MDNAQKAIVVGVALFITIIIVAAVMLITGIGTNLLNKGTDKASNIAAQLDQTELEQYDNTTMSGALVLSAVKKYYTDSNIIVYVDYNGTTGNGTCITPRKLSTNPPTRPTDTTTSVSVTGSAGLATNSQPALGDFSQVSSGNYISPSSQWHAYLIKSNGGAIGIYFKKK